MSDDQLDNELKKRIRQVFDNYEDNTAGDGWLLLREKYPEQERKPVMIWLWRVAGIAAVLLIALGAGLWFNSHQTIKQRPALAAKKAENNKTAPLIAKAVPNNSGQLPGTTSNNTTRSPVKAAGAGASYVAIGTTAKPITTPAKIAHQPANKSLLFTSTTVKGEGKTVNPNYIAPSYPADNHTQTAIIAQSGQKQQPFMPVDSAVIINNDQSSSSNTVAAAKPVEKPENALVKSKPDKSIQSLFDNDNKYNTAQNSGEPKIKYKKVAFAIYAATYVNYAKGSANQFNTGMGLTSDIRLTQNLSISTGLAITQNSLSYNNSINSNNINGNIADGTAAAFSPPVASSRNFSVAGSALTPVIPTSKSLNANLVGLDVPVNIKYVFNPEKGNTYVAAGLSSGTFINQTYNYNYNYSAGSSNSLSQDQSSHNSFGGFYFASMVNVSFGVGYPVGKSQLIIEPFVKYPLSGLGDQHILFGSGGLNLKFNFDPPKKR